jgi:hypothetical protein
MMQQLSRKRRLVQRMFSTSHRSHTSDVDDDNNDKNKHDKILLPITTTAAAAATAVTTPARRQKPMMNNMNMMIDSGLCGTTSDDSDWLYCCVEIPKDSDECGETKSLLPPPPSQQQQHGREQTKQQQQRRRRRQPMIILLQRYSRIASWICVIDCTILPIVTFLIPLLSGGLKSSNNYNSSSSILEFIHSIGDYSVIYFLLPVGTVSVTLQYYASHQQLWIFVMGVIGLVFVTIANFYNLPIVGHIDIFHIFHGGIYHRLLNIFGCTCLIGSNHIARIYHQRRYNNNSGNNNEYDDTACCVLHQYYDSKNNNNKKKNKTTKHYHKPYALRLHV